MAYVIMEASAKVSGKARKYGRYVHVAVVELEPDCEAVPAKIDKRAKGIRRIIWDSGPVSDGKTERCAAARARCEAEKIVQWLIARDVEALIGMAPAP